MIGIYKITSPSGKIYIGQSIDYDKRIADYKYLDCKAQIRLYNSLKKYGYSKHVFEFIEECEIKELNNRERYWQDYYNVISKNGLNCKLTKSDDKSGKLSKSTRQKISKSNTGYKHSEEAKIKMSINNGKYHLGKKGELSPFFGKKLSETHKENISKAGKGRIWSEEAKINMSKNSHFSKKVICTVTNKIWISAKEAALDNNIKYRWLVEKLSGRNKNKTTFKYYNDGK